MPTRHLGDHRVAALLALLCASGCVPAAPTNDQALIENAMNDDLAIVEAASDRADRLDEKAGELLDQANRADAAIAGALRSEANDDLAAASMLRRQGATDGERAETGMERNAGLLNGD